jgi:ferric-dicitrate binding protein FerR (iron transport regulator)
VKHIKHVKRMQHKIQACLDGELSAAQVAEVRDHCAQCPECEQLWRETERLWRIVAAGAAPPLGRSLWSGIHSRLAQRPPSWLPYATAGAGALVLAAGLLLGLRLGAVVDSGRDTGTTLLEEGSLLVEGSEPTLDRLYLATIAAESEVVP